MAFAGMPPGTGAAFAFFVLVVGETWRRRDKAVPPVLSHDLLLLAGHCLGFGPEPSAIGRASASISPAEGNGRLNGMEFDLDQEGPFAIMSEN
jgi:hypothetical protein